MVFERNGFELSLLPYGFEDPNANLSRPEEMRNQEHCFVCGNFQPPGLGHRGSCFAKAEKVLQLDCLRNGRLVDHNDQDVGIDKGNS